MQTENPTAEKEFPGEIQEDNQVKIIELKKRDQEEVPLKKPRTLKEIEYSYEIDLLTSDSYSELENSKLIEIWRKLIRVKMQGKKSTAILQTIKDDFLNVLVKQSEFIVYDDKYFNSNQSGISYVATLKIKGTKVTSLWFKESGEIIKTDITMNKNLLSLKHEELLMNLAPPSHMIKSRI